MPSLREGDFILNPLSLSFYDDDDDDDDDDAQDMES